MKKRLVAILTLILYSLTMPLKVQAWKNDFVDDNGDNIPTIGSLTDVFELIITNTLRLVGIAAFIMIILGGFKYLTSGSDPKNTETAKQTITFGIIGLLVAVGAWFIVYAISNFTGNTEILKFNLTTE